MSSHDSQHDRGEANMSAAGVRPVQLSSVVLAVYELEPSIEFYRDLLGMEVTVTDYGAALLVSPDGFQLYLHALGKRAEHALDSVGVHTVIWTVPEAEDLRRCEQWLQARDAYVQRWDADDYTMVEGRDPSKLPVLLVYPGPNQSTRREILSRLYAL